MGIDFDGGTTDDFLGQSVALSRDGLRLAIASPGGAFGRGSTRVFFWSDPINDWVQIGQDIVGSGANDGLGFSIALNEDGSRIVLGAPEANNDDGALRVYELNVNSTWQILGGNEITPGVGDKGHVGVDVAINNAGDVVAVGCPRTSNLLGRVFVYQLVNGTWVPLGQSINSVNSYVTYTGASIAITGNGLRLIIGGRLGSLTKGHAVIYDYDSNTAQWVLNARIDGEDYYDRFGGDVDISEDGTRIIVGAFTSDGPADNLHDAGDVQVYQFDGTTWNTLGQKLVGTVEDRLGESVAISGDGKCFDCSK